MFRFASYVVKNTLCSQKHNSVPRVIPIFQSTSLDVSIALLATIPAVATSLRLSITKHA